MKVHEYQGKEILRHYGVVTPQGIACFSVDEAVAAAEKLGGQLWVVKAQIYAGGRGKGGGVKLARSIDDVRQLASEILGMTLVTHQTGPEGRIVHRLLIEQGVDTSKEYYVGMVVDRGRQRVCMMASSEGGMDIEQVAADTPEKMVALGEDRVREEIRTIGLFKTKAKNVIALSEQLIRDHNGEVPEDRDALEKLPGVGRKTANVVLNIFFGQPTIAVDTHLFRLGNRIGIAPGKTPLDVERAMEKAVPVEYGLHAHHWLILHGRYICKARKPECRRCVIYDLCKSPEKEQMDAVPEIAERVAGWVAAGKTRLDV